MENHLTSKALANFEARRDVWQEVQMTYGRSRLAEASG